MKKYLTFKEVLFVLFLIFIDQMIKFNISSNSNVGDTLHHTNLIDIVHLNNYGVSLGIFYGKLIIIYVVVIIALIILFKLKKDNRDKIVNLGFLLIIAGALGNVLDRIIHGFVIDYIKLNFINFPIFNFADVLITLGVVTIIIKEIINEIRK